jgi:hypothetical protein
MKPYFGYERRRPDYIVRDQFDDWRAAVTSGTYTPLSDEEIQSMWHWTQRHGWASSWTGTSGMAATLICKLLREREWLLWTLERMRDENL